MYRIVARQPVLRAEARCVSCKEPFTAANVHTEAGMREIAISGLCENCFDEIFEGYENDE